MMELKELKLNFLTDLNHYVATHILRTPVVSRSCQWAARTDEKKTLQAAAQNRVNAVPAQQETANHCSDASLQVIVSSVKQAVG